jgi:hypothetical protein
MQNMPIERGKVSRKQKRASQISVERAERERERERDDREEGHPNDVQGTSECIDDGPVNGSGRSRSGSR